MQSLTWVGTSTGGYASLWCLYIQNEKSTITAIAIIGTSEYSKVLNRGGFGVTGLEVAAGEKQRTQQNHPAPEAPSTLIF